MGEPAWSPDGQWIAFETWPDGANHNIAILRASCTDYQDLTTDPALDFDATWRPVP
jgi:Tol biopolymer transport system component